MGNIAFKQIISILPFSIYDRTVCGQHKIICSCYLCIMQFGAHGCCPNVNPFFSKDLKNSWNIFRYLYGYARLMINMMGGGGLLAQWINVFSLWITFNTYYCKGEINISLYLKCIEYLSYIFHDGGTNVFFMQSCIVLGCFSTAQFKCTGTYAMSSSPILSSNEEFFFCVYCVWT